MNLLSHHHSCFLHLEIEKLIQVMTNHDSNLIPFFQFDQLAAAPPIQPQKLSLSGVQSKTPVVTLHRPN